MADQTLEERVAKLEAEMASLKTVRTQEVSTADSSDVPWWKAVSGVFKDDPLFDEAMRLGREYRESHFPSDEEDKA